MSERMRRVNSLLKETIAEEVEELKDPRLGFVTVTSVDTSPDLRHATVYYGVIGTPEEVSGSGDALNSAAPRISAAVGRQVHLKFTPRLRFRLDESLERSARISALLRDVIAEDEAAAEAAEPEESPDE